MPTLFIISALDAPKDQTGFWIFMVIFMAAVVFSSLLFTKVMVPLPLVASLGGTGELIVL